MKLSDFGESRLRSQDQDNVHTAQVGTHQWMAPEMCEMTAYTQAVDVYSFGIVMWELLTEEQPFRGCTVRRCVLVCGGVL